MKLTEKIARTLCWKNGMDPDLSLGGDKQNFLWMEYEDQANAVISDVRDFVMRLDYDFLCLFDKECGDIYREWGE
jgi:hypothetical protein